MPPSIYYMERREISVRYEEFLPQRLTQLRMQKNVSARDMSLSLGQANNYINSIENRKALPSMQSFFYICEYLGAAGVFRRGQRLPRAPARADGRGQTP